MPFTEETQSNTCPLHGSKIAEPHVSSQVVSHNWRISGPLISNLGRFWVFSWHLVYYDYQDSYRILEHTQHVKNIGYIPHTCVCSCADAFLPQFQKPLGQPYFNIQGMPNLTDYIVGPLGRPMEATIQKQTRKQNNKLKQSEL